jgi:hypothetical protein
MSVVIACGACAWEQEYRDQETANRKLAVHRQARHGDKPLDGVVQLDTVNWRQRALDAIRILAASGEDFALSEIHTMGVGEPLNPRYDWGNLSRDVHRLGIAHPVDYALSKRPETRKSSVRKWSADKSRCEKHGAGAKGQTA